MATVTLKNITKVYDNGFQAVDNFNVEIDNKEFVVLLGPSGCGKTTTLRMIAGLEEISGGDLLIDDKKVNDVPPKDRDIAMVFQNYALYPHMTVFENMAFGLKLRKIPKDKIKERVEQASKILKLETLLDRKPKQLSGGQRQRVALGRAIVRNPKVFLFDEPLSNLDAKLRGHMRAELAALHHRLGTTMIYVTHDQIEAMTLGDKIIIMKDGLIQQVGSPLDLYDKPKNKFVAGFIGSPPMNLFDMQVSVKGKDIILSNEYTNIEISGPRFAKLLDYDGKNVTMGIRPENFSKSNKKNPKNFLTGKVEVVENLGAETYVYVPHEVSDKTQESEGSEDFYVIKLDRNIDIAVNEVIHFELVLDKIHVFDNETEETLVSE